MALCNNPVLQVHSEPFPGSDRNTLFAMNITPNGVISANVEICGSYFACATMISADTDSWIRVSFVNWKTGAALAVSGHKSSH